MAGAAVILGTVPLAIGAATITRVVETSFPRDRKGRLMGSTHYHYKGKTGKAISHKHPGGHISHMHRGLPGYGKTKKSLRR